MIQYKDNKGARMLLRQGIKEWLSYNRRHTILTQRLYSGIIQQFSKSIKPIRKVEDVQPCHINNYISSYLAGGVKSRTANNHIITLKSFFRYFEENHDIPSPAKAPKVKFLKEDEPHRRFLTNDEIKKLFKVCQNQYHKDLMMFILNSGLRATEMANLRWDNIDKPLEWLTLQGKGRKVRAIPINCVLKKILLSYSRRPGNIQFAKSRTNQYLFMTRLCCKAKIEKAGPHALRRAFAMKLAEAGCPITHLQLLLGHSSVKTTEAYLGFKYSRSYLKGSTECLTK